jgi:hypothetical protein
MTSPVISERDPPSAEKRKFPYHLKMRAKKSDFLEKSDFSNFGTTQKESQEIRFFGKIGFLKFGTTLRCQEIRFFGKIDFLEKSDFGVVWIFLLSCTSKIT